MKHALYFLFIIFIFQGCASIPDLCSSYGFSPGTDSFANCMMSESQNRRQRIANTWQKSFNDLAESKRRRSESYRNNRINCNSYKMGNTINTNCY